MRFPVAFSRWQGAVPTGKVALGADGAAGAPPSASPNPSMDNLLVSRFYSNQGWPAHRIAVGYKGPASAIALVAQVWVWDVKTLAWYEVGAPGTVTPNRISYFDVVALLDGPGTGANPLDAPTQGSLIACLVVQDNAGTPDGEYIFTMGADLTVLPI